MRAERIVQRSGTTRSMASTATASAIGMLPFAMVGAHGPLLLAELGNDATVLGLAASAFFLPAAVASVVAGRSSRRVMPAVMISAAVSVSGGMLVLMAIGVGNWALLLLAVGIAGAASAFVHVGGSQLLTGQVPSNRLGYAFGVKQSAIPMSAILAGGLLLGLGVTAGWRWSFAAAGILVLVPLALLAGKFAEERGADRAVVPWGATGPFLLAMGAGACANVAGSSLTPFLVVSVTSRGVSAPVAGVLLSLGGAAGVVARVGIGHLADRVGLHPLTIMGFLLATGVVGFVFLATSTSVPLFALGTLLAFAGGWGWAGLLLLAVVRADRSSAASALGTVAVGPYIGAIVGPLLFGYTVSELGYGTAWLVPAAFCVAAFAFTISARSQMPDIRNAGMTEPERLIT